MGRNMCYLVSKRKGLGRFFFLITWLGVCGTSYICDWPVYFHRFLTKCLTCVKSYYYNIYYMKQKIDYYIFMLQIAETVTASEHDDNDIRMFCCLLHLIFSSVYISSYIIDLLIIKSESGLLYTSCREMLNSSLKCYSMG